jgi:CRISPR-associated endonuclease/helicase Cas3
VTRHSSALAHRSSITGEEHDLAEHLRAVAAGAHQAFDDHSASAAIAHLAGLWHDLGKYRAGFQTYIRLVTEGGEDAHIEGKLPTGSDKSHSAAGAMWAWKHLSEQHGAMGAVVARVLQYVIAGHHAGLDNWVSGDGGGLKPRLASPDAQRELSSALAGQPSPEVLVAKFSAPTPSTLPIPFKGSEVIPGRFALWVRMLFSALVDADFLDTEAFLNPGANQSRQRSSASMFELLACLDDYMARKSQAVARAGLSDSAVNQQRAAVLQACRTKAKGAPGTYTLTVPTGGGKTLASMAFALTHAVAHGKRRVVMAIPYTSIIEQTAEVYRDVFAPLGEDIVLEHHSNSESDEGAETARSRLACENWDAPVVVTTNVQLFESLFARKTSRCRKLHNLAHSVLVIDEAHLMPVEYLQPVVDVLRLLVQDHGVTVLLCTATQPTLTQQRRFGGQGLRGYEPGEVTAVIDDEASLYRALQRVRVKLPPDLKTPSSWAETAAEVAQHAAVLAIVGRRADAKTLYDEVRQAAGAEGLWHLSALMCPQHRSEVVADIKAALLQRREQLACDAPATPVRVVSTQLVEAGVDLDFPVVYRALAGLDSIAQAAGRCNREGRLAIGDVRVFVPPKGPPPGLLRKAAQACTVVWDGLTPQDDPLALERISRYFGRLYADAHSLDAKEICDALKLQIDKVDQALAVRFRDAADAFKLIDDKDAATVFVRWRSERCRHDVDMLIHTLERDGPQRWLMRQLQRYGVTIYQHDLRRLLTTGDVREVGPGLYVQSDSDVFYDPVLGARLAGAPGDPAAFVV